MPQPTPEQAALLAKIGVNYDTLESEIAASRDQQIKTALDEPENALLMDIFALASRGTSPDTFRSMIRDLFEIGLVQGATIGARLVRKSQEILVEKYNAAKAKEQK